MSVPGASAESTRVFSPRQRERRRALGDLFAALTRGLDRRSDVSLLRGVFEQMLRRALPVRSVTLRDRASRWGSRSHDGVESIALEVPGGEAGCPAVLEATFNPGASLGEWDFQVLGLATHIAAMVLEIERSRVELARAGLPNNRPKRGSATRLVGSTPVMASLRSTIERVAATDFTVLIEGESGSGKELVAQRIHEASRRRTGPFVALNCAAVVETLLEAELFGIDDRTATGVRGRRGKFEAADGGTLFLDEVSDLSASAQAKLLRATQDFAVEHVGGSGAHRVDVRLIAATNRSLAGLVAQGSFRADLFYRLSGVDIRVPSLRERQGDILELARHFLERHRSVRSLRLSAGAINGLLLHRWPGNVRELERSIERAVAMGESDTIELEDLPPAVRGDYGAALLPSLRLNDTMRAWGARYARLVVERCGGNKRKASRVLGISYHTLQGYLRFQLDEDRYVPSDLTGAPASAPTPGSLRRVTANEAGQ